MKKIFYESDYVLHAISDSGIEFLSFVAVDREGEKIRALKFIKNNKGTWVFHSLGKHLKRCTNIECGASAFATWERCKLCGAPLYIDDNLDDAYILDTNEVCHKLTAKNKTWLLSETLLNKQGIDYIKNILN